jgi:Concanavalin A-like lectin/glucanases superfamily
MALTLVGYWKLDEGTGTTAGDSSGNGNAGTISGSVTWTTVVPPTIAFPDPAALTFDGSTTYVVCGTNNMPALNAPFSLSCWVFISSVAVTGDFILFANTGSGYGFQFRQSSADLQVAIYGGGTQVAAAGVLSQNTWYHVAYTYDGSTDLLYLNGVQVASGTTAHTALSTANVQLGSYFTAGAENFLGTLDDVRIYSGTLSAAQVAVLASGNNLAPLIITQPGDQTYYPGNAATFSINASGATSYQWYTAAGILIVGATSSSYSRTFNYSDNHAGFYCVATNAGGSTQSATAYAYASGGINVFLRAGQVSPNNVALQDPTVAGGAVTVALTGVQATGAVGGVAPATTGALTGVAAAGSAGQLGIGFAITGVAATGSPGTLGATSAVPLTGNAATGQPGTLAPATTAPLTGNAAAGSPGSLGASTQPALTGVAATGAVGSVVPASAVPITGTAATGSPGSLGASTSAPLTGVEGDGAVGSVILPNGGALSGVVATGSPGTMAPGTSGPITGNAATGSAGSVAASTVVALTGVAATGAVGALGSTGTALLVGVAATGQPGSVTGGTTAPITGNAATGSPGSLAPATTSALAGVGAAGAVGSLGPASSVAISGTSATGSAGSLGDSDSAPLTGVQAIGGVGNLTPSTTGSLTGVQGTGAIGALGQSVALTGVAATGAVGSVGVSAPVSVALTGVSATGQIGNLSAVPQPQANTFRAPAVSDMVAAVKLAMSRLSAQPGANWTAVSLKADIDTWGGGVSCAIVSATRVTVTVREKNQTTALVYAVSATGVQLIPG